MAIHNFSARTVLVQQWTKRNEKAGLWFGTPYEYGMTAPRYPVPTIALDIRYDAWPWPHTHVYAIRLVRKWYKKTVMTWLHPELG